MVAGPEGIDLPGDTCGYGWFLATARGVVAKSPPRFRRYDHGVPQPIPPTTELRARLTEIGQLIAAAEGEADWISPESLRLAREKIEEAESSLSWCRLTLRVMNGEITSTQDPPPKEGRTEYWSGWLDRGARTDAEARAAHRISALVRFLGENGPGQGSDISLEGVRLQVEDRHSGRETLAGRFPPDVERSLILIAEVAKDNHIWIDGDPWGGELRVIRHQFTWIDRLRRRFR